MSYLPIYEIINKLSPNPDFEEGILIDAIDDEKIINGIQWALYRAGYYVNTDGIIGQQTYNTWCQFKKDKNLLFPYLVNKDDLLKLDDESTEKFKRDYPGNQVLKPSWKIFYPITAPRRVFLNLIAWCEGTDTILDEKPTGYDFLFNLRRLADFNKDYSDHPKLKGYAGNIASSRAGRYQIDKQDWEMIQRALKLPNFQPEYQDQAALWLIHIKWQALGFVDNLNLWNFCQACHWQWPSLSSPLTYFKDGNYAPVQQAFNKLCDLYGIEL